MIRDNGSDDKVQSHRVATSIRLPIVFSRDVYCKIRVMIERRKTVTVRIGQVPIGSDHPIVVQSMTNTDTADIEATVEQSRQLFQAGSEWVRVTVNTEAAAQAIPEIVDEGLQVPIIGDFHYNGHLLLTRYPECARKLSKYRINPGNVGMGKHHDENFKQMIQVALENDKPIRIGVNWGSLDQKLLARLMDSNARLPEPKESSEVLMDAAPWNRLLWPRSTGWPTSGSFSVLRFPQLPISFKCIATWLRSATIPYTWSSEAGLHWPRC